MATKLDGTSTAHTPRRVGMRQKLRRRTGKYGSRVRRANILAGTILSLMAFLGLFPYLFMVITSFKDNTQFNQSYWVPTFPLHLENYLTAWDQVRGYLWNSLFVAFVSTVGVVIVGSVTAFILSRRELPGRNMLYGLIMLLLMVPFIASLIPLFLLMRDLHLLNTYWVLIIPYITGGVVLCTFLMRTFIEQIPEELFGAAKLDGANGAQIYLFLVLPLSGPIIGTIAMVTLINVWNDYFWPLLTITDNNLRTMTIGVSFFQGQYTTAWGPLFAGYLIASVPLLVFFTLASKYFIAGIQGSSSGGEVVV